MMYSHASSNSLMITGVYDPPLSLSTTRREKILRIISFRSHRVTRFHTYRRFSNASTHSSLEILGDVSVCGIEANSALSCSSRSRSSLVLSFNSSTVIALIGECLLPFSAPFLDRSISASISLIRSLGDSGFGGSSRGTSWMISCSSSNNAFSTCSDISGISQIPRAFRPLQR